MTAVFLFLVVLPSPQASEEGGVRVVLRQEALFSEESLGQVRKGKAIEAGRITFAKPGWFLNGAVTAAEYALRITPAGSDFVLSLQSAEGKNLGGKAFWIDPPTSALPSVDVAPSDGAVSVTIRCEEIRLEYRYVSQEAVDAVAKGISTASGRVVVTSDLGAPELALALARELDHSIDVHASLLGRSAPDGPFHLYLFSSEKKYQAVDQLVSGGRFQRNGAMASPLTMQAYVWNLPRPEAGLTLRLRTVILHEIGHLVSYRVRPDVHAWPVWLQEGLADVGTFRSLNKSEAAAFHADQVGRWRGAEAVGNLPPLQDLLTRYAGADLHGWYTSAYLFTSRVAGPEALLPSLLDRLEGERLQPRGALTALEILESRARPIWRALRDEAMMGPAPPQVHSGHLDAADGDWKISSAAGSGARILLPSIPSPSEGSLEASFSWEAGGGRQADVYLAYSAGRDSAQFLKLAVLPKRVVLFRFYDERWEEWGRIQYPDGLEEGPTAWHSIRLDWSFRERTLRVTIDSNRAAKFFLKSHIPSEGTSIALGSFDSVVHFKDVNVR